VNENLILKFRLKTPYLVAPVKKSYVKNCLAPASSSQLKAMRILYSGAHLKNHSANLEEKNTYIRIKFKTLILKKPQSDIPALSLVCYVSS